MNKKKTQVKILKNAMIGESLLRYSREEKHQMVTSILEMENISQRELAKQLEIPYSTIHDWVSLRQNNVGDKVHLSLTNVVYKLQNIDLKSFNDWGRIEQIKELCEELLKQK